MSVTLTDLDLSPIVYCVEREQAQSGSSALREVSSLIFQNIPANISCASKFQVSRIHYLIEGSTPLNSELLKKITQILSQTESIKHIFRELNTSKESTYKLLGTDVENESLASIITKVFDLIETGQLEKAKEFQNTFPEFMKKGIAELESPSEQSLKLKANVNKLLVTYKMMMKKTDRPIDPIVEKFLILLHNKKLDQLPELIKQIKIESTEVSDFLHGTWAITIIMMGKGLTADFMKQLREICSKLINPYIKQTVSQTLTENRGSIAENLEFYPDFFHCYIILYDVPAINYEINSDAFQKLTCDESEDILISLYQKFLECNDFGYANEVQLLAPAGTFFRHTLDALVLSKLLPDSQVHHSNQFLLCS